ncbi:MAG: hypothetical protein AB2448_09360 [Moorella sp. (in: firmicutes)]
MLYNGAESWTAALSFKEMLDSYQDLSGHLLDFHYLLVECQPLQRRRAYRGGQSKRWRFSFGPEDTPGRPGGTFTETGEGLKAAHA